MRFKLIATMVDFHEELAKAGVLLDDLEDLGPSEAMDRFRELGLATKETR